MTTSAPAQFYLVAPGLSAAGRGTDRGDRGTGVQSGIERVQVAAERMAAWLFLFDEAERHYEALPPDEQKRIQTQDRTQAFASYVAGLAELRPDDRRDRRAQIEEHILMIGMLGEELAEIEYLRREVHRLRNILMGMGAVASTAQPFSDDLGT